MKKNQFFVKIKKKNLNNLDQTFSHGSSIGIAKALIVEFGDVCKNAKTTSPKAHWPSAGEFIKEMKARNTICHLLEI